MLLPLVAVSGTECVDALRLAGFAVRSRSDDATYLVNGVRSVTIPSAGMLAPDVLVELLRQAGVAYADFLDLLSEAPTDPDIRIVPLVTAAAGR